jgi:adenosylcobinamide-GDP ribazoletransferase
MKGFILAMQFLTRLPTPRVEADDAAFAASMRWFPAVGAVIGMLIAGAAWAGQHVDPWTGALAALATWVLVTGALHLDGLADITDAGGAAHKDKAKLLAVLADPHVGSFGVVAIGLQLSAKLVLLHGMIAANLLPMLIPIPFAARIGPLVWTLWLPPLHAGLAARFRDSVRTIDIGFWVVALIASAWIAPAVLTAPLLIALWGWHVRAKLGGISGDGHGAGIELVETGLLALVMASGAL